AVEFQGQTQLEAVSAILNCGTGRVNPAPIALPAPTLTDFERFEGMLVQFNQPLYVTEHFQLGRFGQVVLSTNSRLTIPTQIAAPGAPAQAIQAQNNLNRIILDDSSQAQNPDPIVFARNGQPLSASNTLRGGDRVDNIVGVLTFTWGGNAASPNAYRIRPLNALGGSLPNFIADNPRPAAAPARVGRVRVASSNVLNFFNTFDGLPDTVDNCAFGFGGPPADCRGADTAAEFARQLPKTVTALLGMNADVIGVIEIENDGYGAGSAIQLLVNEMNAVAGAGAWAFIDADSATGQVNALGTDAIKVGLLYKPGVVTPAGTTAALNTVAFVNGGDADPRNRPALAQ
ncbi:MAG: ExeM/NucH family extracellular endonuclease, partial [Caldilineaceae bacterium]